MPYVTLIDYTGRGSPDPWYAANILLFAKATRLNMSPETMDEIQDESPDTKRELLRDMAKTIPSSWEFVDVTFLFSGVTRACAQQITRTRTGSYAMQSQRVVNMSGADVTNPCAPGDPHHQDFTLAAQEVLRVYNLFIDDGMPAQMARGILPMNTQCNLVAKYNLRSFVDLVRARSSLRTQDEYAQIVAAAKAAVLDAWPWADVFFEDPNSVAIRELENVARELGVTPGSGFGWRVAKAIDLLRKN